MRNKKLILAMTAVLFVSAGLYAPSAFAQIRRQGSRVSRGAIPRSRSGMSSRSRAPSRSGLSRTPSTGRSLGSSRGSGLFGNSGLLGNSGSSKSSERPGLTALSDILDRVDRARGDDRSRYPGRYDSGKEYAKAYRDAAFANALVNLVGIIVQANAYNRRPEPAAQYVTEKVIVQEGRYETYQVWVPERYDPSTGRKLGGGFSETRTRWVPEVAEYRQVFVPR